jgi:hypothetical protein
LEEKGNRRIRIFSAPGKLSFFSSIPAFVFQSIGLSDNENLCLFVCCLSFVLLVSHISNAGAGNNENCQVSEKDTQENNRNMCGEMTEDSLIFAAFFVGHFQLSS